MEVFSQKSARNWTKEWSQRRDLMDGLGDQPGGLLFAISLLNLRTTNSQLFKVHYLHQTLFQQVQLISGDKRYGSLSNLAAFMAMALAKEIAQKIHLNFNLNFINLYNLM